MGRSKIYFLLIIGINWMLPVAAQDRYAVYFRYKPQTEYHLDEPVRFLTEKAIHRREREKIQVDSTDLPVSSAYIHEISESVDKIHYHSKWLNATVVVASEEQIDRIHEFPFVDKVELVAKGYYGENHNARKEILKEEIKLSLRLKKKYDYDFQNEILGIQDMHEEGFTGKDIQIAIFDAGFLNADKISGLKHLFENDQIRATRDFVIPGSDNVYRTDAHGTAALSLLASNEPGRLISGAYNADFILCITEDVASEYRVEELNWVRAAEFSDSLGVDIINSSLGYNYFDDPMMNYSKEDMDGKTALISIGASMAAQKGILVVSSAGNEGNFSWRTITAPADAEGILAIGAVTSSLSKASFSSTGPTADGRIKPELVAYGSGVTLWRSIQNPSTSSGTSFSAPQVAALAAGLWEAKPEWTRQEIMDSLLDSGSQSEDPDSELGYGIPSFILAYQGKGQQVPEFEIAKTVIYPNPLEGNKLYIQYGVHKECDFTLINTAGKVLNSTHLQRISNRFPYEVNLYYETPGMYLIGLNEGNRTEFFRLIKR